LRFHRNSLFAAAIAVTISACGNGGGVAERPSEEESAAPSAGLPVREPTGEIDEALAETGEALFQTKGCVACHTFGGGRLTGPDLAGVTGRRTFPWIYHQITVPDSMTTYDPTAKQLMAEYMTQMPNLGLQPEEALALYEYLREQDAASAEEEDE
jgi:mono/diheme cytochrome c family protein